jgi:uncharacterized protein YegL
MLSTKLTTINDGILSNTSIPEIIKPLIKRRTNNKRIFGTLEINVPQVSNVTPAAAAAAATAVASTPRRIIAGFLLDNSGSMQGRKIQHAINTIKQLAEILLSERDGKTIASQPIHSWIYVITFNSDAEVVIPFQEITAESLPIIITQLDQIRTMGSTNYERAFKKQTEVIADIIRGFRRGLSSPETTGPYHLIRFFETDGEITDGMRSTEILYKMMRDTGDDYDTDAPLTFEDYILGYGKDVDLNCLETLASPYQRSEYLLNRSSAYNCSSLITIIKPEDIGWQMGELLFKVIMRYGYKVQVSISGPPSPLIELFEYQSHQWSNTTTLHSIIHGERKTLYIQYTRPSPSDDDTTVASTASTASTTPVLVKVQYSNQFTGSTYTYEFEHTIIPSHTTDATISVPDLPVILGMIQIEIFKQFREIEAGTTDKDTIVREAYNTLRMLKSLNSIEPIAINLTTDVKVIIGLTTIQDKKEQMSVIHARRIASAEQDIFNIGANISRNYIDGEEDYEEEAAKVIKELRCRQSAAEAAAETAAEEEQEFESADDAIPTRIPTVIDTQTGRHGHYGRHGHHDDISELRTLCARIAIAKKDKEDFTTEQLYDQVRQYGGRAARIRDYRDHPGLDETFSSTPMDDEYTQRRMGMMRQMSSGSQTS